MKDWLKKVLWWTHLPLILGSIIGAFAWANYMDSKIPPHVSPILHTGIVTITDISVGFCEMQQKGGTALCDLTVTYRTQDGRILNLGLVRSGQWPPVWKGARGDIVFWLNANPYSSSPGAAVISEFDQAP